MTDEELIAELRAKAHASTRYKVRARTPSPYTDHVCWRAAEALVRLTRPPSEKEVERAARASWSHTIGEQVSDEQWATMRDVEIPAMKAGLSVLEGRDV